MSKILDVCLGEDETPCGGKIKPIKKDGRFYEFKNVLINLPESLSIPRCNKCHKDHLSKEMEVIVNNVLASEYMRHQELIESAIQRHQNG